MGRARTALVTGGAGFIGSHLVRGLLEAGVAVRVLDNFDTGRREFLDGLDIDVVEGDIRTDSERAVAGCDHVFHLAAIASVPRSIAQPAASFEVNTLGSSRLFEACRKEGVSRVVCTSTAAVYGPTSGRVHEDTPLRPQSPYGAENAGMEHLASAYSASLGLDVLCLRLFNVYGPRQDARSPYSGVIAAFAAALGSGRVPVVHGDGSQSRDFVHVSDVVRAILLTADRGEPGATYNVGTGHPTSVLELLRALQTAMAAPDSVELGPRRPADVHTSCADISRLAALGYAPTVSLEQGLVDTVTWYRSQRA